MSYAPESTIQEQLFSHIVPECYVKNITLRSGGGNLKVTLSLCVTDIIEDDILSSWMVQATQRDEDVSPFEEFINISFSQVTHPTLDKIFNKQLTFEEARQEGFVNDDGRSASGFAVTKKINLADHLKQHSSHGKNSIDKFKKRDAYGNVSIEYPIQTTFEVSPASGDPRGVRYLAYYIWTELDIEAMSQKMGISKKYFEKYGKKITKRVKKELVIEDYNTITYTNVFITPSGELWKGPMHKSPQSRSRRDSSSGWFTGSTYTLQSVPLEIRSIQNKKIRDFRLMNRVGQKYVSVMNRRRAAGLTGKYNKALTLAEDSAIISTLTNHTKRLSEKGFSPDKSSAEFGTLWTATDELHHGNFLFAFNWMPFLRKNCAYPHLWSVSSKTTEKLLNLATIQSMKITRSQVDVTHRSSNALGTPHLPMKLKDNDIFIETQLAETSEEPAQSSIKVVNTSKCYLKETKIGLDYSTANHRQVRWFTMTDRGLVKEKNGNYQYSVSIRALDPTQGFMKNQIAKLRTAKEKLSKYLAFAEGYQKGKPCYDVYLDRFTQDFLDLMNTQGKLFGGAMWKDPVDTYLNVLDDVSGILNQPAYAGASYTLKTALPPALSSYVDPRKGSPEGILILLKLIDNLEMALDKMTQGAYSTSTKFGAKGWVGLGNRTTAGGVEKKTPKSVAAQKVLESDHVFDVEINLGGQRGMGYDYLTNQTLDFMQESIKGAGLRTISARYFKKRCDIETQRFYGVVDQSFSWNLLAKEAPSLTLSDATAGDTLDTNKYSYLSPAFVFSSPGLSLPSVGGFGGSMGSSPPPTSTGGASGGQGTRPGATFATSYAMGSSGKNSLLAASNFIKNLAPVMLLNQTMSPKGAQEPKTLDDLAVDIAAQQANPDMSLYPVEVEAYKDPSVHKDTKLSAEEQSLKSKYVGVLGMKGCLLVEEKKEFDEPNFHSEGHPEGYNINSINFGKQAITFVPETFLQRIKTIGVTSPVWKSSIPMLSKNLATINPLPLFKPLLQSNQGFKGGGPAGHISYNSIHLSNFKLLDFSDTSTPNILTKINPSTQAAVMKSLPNSLKSLALSKQNFVADDLFEIPTTIAGNPEVLPPPSIYDPENMQKVYELFHNTMRIEYLDTFAFGDEQDTESGIVEKQKGSELLLRAPVWRLLNRDKINDLEAGENVVSLLCRLTRYKNKDLGIGYDTLSLPIIDEYFLMVVDPQKAAALGAPAPPEEEYITPADDTDGDHEHNVDFGDLNLYPDLSKFRWLNVDGEELLVKEFEGQVKCGN